MRQPAFIPDNDFSAAFAAKSLRELEMKKLHRLPATRNKHRAFLLLLLFMITFSQLGTISTILTGFADEFARHE
jgi:hypothetical protein